MRKGFAIVAALTLSLALASHALAEDNLLSGHLGVVFPGNAYDDSHDSNGYELGVSMVRLNEYAGLEVGLNGYNVGSTVKDTSALGVEALVHFQTVQLTIQPYIAFGLSMYMTKHYALHWGEVEDTSTGFIVKAGARHYLKKRTNGGGRYFYGAFIKMFSNNIYSSSYYSMNSFNDDVGGMSLCFEIGLWTD